jgi:alpha-glucuronidase
VTRIRALWAQTVDTGLVDPALYDRVAELLDEQVRCATEWRDQINTHMFRKSGVPDAHGRRIY